jgi:pyruvate formate lyase activating enzyme
VPVWIRRVIVPGLTDGEEDLQRTGEFIRSLGNVERVEVLPYHNMGEEKWRALGLNYSLSDVEAPSECDLSRARFHLSNSPSNGTIINREEIKL